MYQPHHSLNHMKKILLIVLPMCFFAAFDLLAQPTLTASGINPVLNDIINQVNGGYVSPGSSGASQTWDLSTMTTGAATPSAFIAASSTPNASSFPAANLAISSGGSYAYYTTTSSAWQNAGVVSSNGVVMSYFNREDLLRFPFSYTNTYTDTWATTFVSGGYTYYRTGITTVTADSYGTLMTPAGTFSNVMRVHFFQDYQDSTMVGGSPFIITYENDEYMWYLNGNHNPIALVYDLSVNGGTGVQAGVYMTGVLGVEENSALVSYELFPNPVSSNLNIHLTLEQKKNISIFLYNAVGAQVGIPVTGEATHGENSYCVSVEDMPPGIYCAEVMLDGIPVSTRNFVVNR